MVKIAIGFLIGISIAIPIGLQVCKNFYTKTKLPTKNTNLANIINRQPESGSTLDERIKENLDSLRKKEKERFIKWAIDSGDCKKLEQWYKKNWNYEDTIEEEVDLEIITGDLQALCDSVKKFRDSRFESYLKINPDVHTLMHKPRNL